MEGGGGGHLKALAAAQQEGGKAVGDNDAGGPLEQLDGQRFLPVPVQDEAWLDPPPVRAPPPLAYIILEASHADAHAWPEGLAASDNLHPQI